MHEFASYNGQMIRAAEAMIGAISSAALYGRGVFTTIAIQDGKPFLWEKHWQRLLDDSARLGIELKEFGEAWIAASLTELIAKNNVINGRARVTFFDGSGGGVWDSGPGQGNCLFIITGDAKQKPANLRLTVSPYPINSRSPLAGIKSCNYLENLLALEEARSRGFDEAVRINERGDIVSACMANIFWEKDEKLFTPALTSGCLRGTIRDFVIEKYGAVETDAGIDGLNSADSIFLTSSGIGITPVAALDERKFAPTVYRLDEWQANFT